MSPIRLSLAVLYCAASLALHAQGAYLVKDINTTADSSTSSSNPSQFFDFGGRVFFTASVSSVGEQLFVTNGNSTSASVVVDLNTASSSASTVRFAAVNGKLLFNATDS